MNIYESAENYLETILILHNKSGAVRSIDIASELEFSKPSVSVAMKKLRENGLITVDADGFISLTGDGRTIAETMYERHTVLTKCLVAIGVDEKTAAADACKIEHAISSETFERIREYLNRKHAQDD